MLKENKGHPVHLDKMAEMVKMVEMVYLAKMESLVDRV